MKATGITRRIDDLGRVVIPREIRDNLHIREGDALEILLEDGNLVLHPLEVRTPAHILLDAADDLDRACKYTYASKLRALAREMKKEEE